MKKIGLTAFVLCLATQVQAQGIIYDPQAAHEGRVAHETRERARVEKEKLHRDLAIAHDEAARGNFAAAAEAEHRAEKHDAKAHAFAEVSKHEHRAEERHLEEDMR